MTRIVFVVLVVMLARAADAQDLCATGTSAPPDAGVQLVCRALAAVNAFDARVLERLMADDFSLTGVTGRYFGASKAEMIQRWTTPPGPGASSRTRLTYVFRTHASGNMRFVSGELLDESAHGRERICEAHAFTDVWERRSGAWVWVHSHESGQRTVPCP